MFAPGGGDGGGARGGRSGGEGGESLQTSVTEPNSATSVPPTLCECRRHCRLPDTHTAAKHPLYWIQEFRHVASLADPVSVVRMVPAGRATFPRLPMLLQISVAGAAINCRQHIQISSRKPRFAGFARVANATGSGTGNTDHIAFSAIASSHRGHKLAVSCRLLHAALVRRSA